MNRLSRGTFYFLENVLFKTVCESDTEFLVQRALDFIVRIKHFRKLLNSEKKR